MSWVCSTWVFLCPSYIRTVKHVHDIISDVVRASVFSVLETKRHTQKDVLQSKCVAKILNLNFIDKCDECGGILINAIVKLFVYAITHIYKWYHCNTIVDCWLRIFSKIQHVLGRMHMGTIFFKSIFYFPREKSSCKKLDWFIYW